MRKKIVLSLFTAVIMLCTVVLSACGDNGKTEPVQLGTPENLSISDTTLSWSAVENASGYNVKIDDENATDNGTATTFTLAMTTPKTYTIYVQAYGDGKDYTTSEWASEQYTVEDETSETYTILWKNWDGITLETDNNVASGTVPTYNGATPAKDEDANYTYTFNNQWSPAITAVTGNQTYIAQFTATPKQTNHETFTIAVSSNNSDWGTATGGGEFEDGESVTLTATAKTGYKFDNWMDGATVVSTNAVYAFEADKTVSLVANFSTATDIGIETFMVSVGANNISYGGVMGGGEYESGDTATLDVTPFPGYKFDNWTVNGVVVSEIVNYSFTVTENISLVANFSSTYVAPETCTVSVSANNPAYGTVSGGGEYELGRSVTVLATAKTGYQFDNWTINGTIVTTSGAYGFEATANVSLVANFSAKSIDETIAAVVVVTANNPAYGTVTGGGEYKAWGIREEGGDYEDAETVTLTATPAVGYRFSHWDFAVTNTFYDFDSTYTATTNPLITRADYFSGYAYGTTVEATAVFESLGIPGTQEEGDYAIYVTGGTGSGFYQPDETITITADDPAFIHWGLEYPAADNNSMVMDKTFTFTIQEYIDGDKYSYLFDNTSNTIYFTAIGRDRNMGFAVMETDTLDWSGDHSFEIGYTDGRATPTIDGMYKEQVEAVFFDADPGVTDWTPNSWTDSDQDVDTGDWAATQYFQPPFAIGGYTDDPETVYMRGSSYTAQTDKEYIVVFWLYDYYHWETGNIVRARVERVYTKAEITAAGGEIVHEDLSGHNTVTIKVS